MGQILLCSNHIPLTTSINNSFIKKYMLDANGSYVKVYLYLCMCLQSGERDLSISRLADMMESTENDIIRALHYWEKKGLMALQRDEAEVVITGIDIVNPDGLPGSAKVSPARQSAFSESVVCHKENPLPLDGQAAQETSSEKNGQAAAVTAAPAEGNTASAQEITVTEEQMLRLSHEKDFTWICQIVENYLMRPLKSTEVQLLAYLFDTLHFSKDLILHLYEYCCSMEKTNVKYVQAVALSWAEQDITTPEQAQQHAASHSAVHSAISQALALKRPLAKIEYQYIDRWQNEWEMDLSVILDACNRTMLAIQRADFKYIHGILKNWHKENVHTLQDVKISDEKYSRSRAEKKQPAKKGTPQNTSQRKVQFQSFQQREVSREELNQLEQMLLTEK